MSPRCRFLDIPGIVDRRPGTSPEGQRKEFDDVTDNVLPGPDISVFKDHSEPGRRFPAARPI